MTQSSSPPEEKKRKLKCMADCGKALAVGGGDIIFVTSTLAQRPTPYWEYLLPRHYTGVARRGMERWSQAQGIRDTPFVSLFLSKQPTICGDNGMTVRTSL